MLLRVDILKVAISGTQIWLSEQKPNPLAFLFGQGLTESEGGLKHVSDRAWTDGLQQGRVHEMKILESTVNTIVRLSPSSSASWPFTGPPFNRNHSFCTDIHPFSSIVSFYTDIHKTARGSSKELLIQQQHIAITSPCGSCRQLKAGDSSTFAKYTHARMHARTNAPSQV